MELRRIPILLVLVTLICALWIFSSPEHLSLFLTPFQGAQQDAPSRPPAKADPTLRQIVPLTVYNLKGQKIDNFDTGRTCAKVCTPDVLAPGLKFTQDCLDAGYKAVSGFCCDVYCTGKVSAH